MIKNLFPISSFFKIKFMFKHIFYAVLLFISATTSQCSKTTTAVPDDPNALPPETQTGAGTYACKINGVVWKYSNPSFSISQSKQKTRLEFFPFTNGGYLSLAGTRYDSNDSGIDLLGLFVGNLNNNKNNVLGTNKINFSLAYTNNNSANYDCTQFITTYPSDTTIKANLFQVGKVNITKLDNVNRIISGNFSCSILHAGCDTLKITEGRFDFKF